MKKTMINSKFSGRNKEEKLPIIRSASSFTPKILNTVNSPVKQSVKSRHLSPTIKLNSKDPTVKRLRFDHRIFFKSKLSPKPQKRLDKSSFLSIPKNLFVKNRKVPVRFYPVQLIQEELKLQKKSPTIKLESVQDLQLLKEINLDRSYKQLELDRFYNEKLTDTQKPPTPESLVDDFIRNHKEKRVTFCLNTSHIIKN